MQQRLRLGSDSGTLTLHTGVEGRVAKVGHRLVIAIRDWEATATLSGDRAVSACMTAELSSFDVVSGEGGVKPLSDKDRAGIRDNGSTVTTTRTSDKPANRRSPHGLVRTRPTPTPVRGGPAQQQDRRWIRAKP